jgi:hypothetical protein
LNNLENFDNYFVIKYSNNNNKIITNEFITDFQTREELYQKVNNFFQFSKNSFISTLLDDKDVKDIIQDGSLSLQYIFVYKIANTRYSYDVYNLTY